MIRTVHQDNPQRFDIQKLAVRVSLEPEQLTFREFIEGDRVGVFFEVKGEPRENRTTRLFDPGVAVKYRFVESRTKPTVRFCWTVERNAAGRFLIFRERIFRKHALRDQVEAIGEKIAAIRACRGNLQDLEARRAARANRRGTR